MFRTALIFIMLLCFHVTVYSQYKLADTLAVFNYVKEIDSSESYSVHIAEGTVMNSGMRKRIGGFGEYTYSDRNDTISKITYHAAYNHRNFYIICYYKSHKLILVKQVAGNSITGTTIISKTNYLANDSLYHKSIFHAKRNYRKELAQIEKKDVIAYGYQILREKLAHFKEDKQFIEDMKGGKYLEQPDSPVPSTK